MKIRLSISDLRNGLDMASTVKPTKTGSNQSAYLFTVTDGKLHIHSDDETHYVRVEVPVENAEDGSFVYPADRIDALKYLDGWIEIEAGNEGDRFWLKYKTEGGATANRNTYNPKGFTPRDALITGDGQENVFPTVLLKEGAATCGRYLSTDDKDKPFDVLQVFDASSPDHEKGDGTMYSADGYRSCYFYASAFKGKGLKIHQAHIPSLQNFLNKCSKSVKVKVGPAWTFVTDQVSPGVDGAVFGFSNSSKNHSKYNYYPGKYDKVVLSVSKDLVLKTLRQIRSEMKDTKRDKIRIQYADGALKFTSSSGGEEAISAPVSVVPKNLEDGSPSENEFSANANINNMIGLFESARGFDVEFKVAFVEGGTKSQRALFRTVEVFHVSDEGKLVIPTQETAGSSYECRVTHFSTSME